MIKKCSHLWKFANSFWIDDQTFLLVFYCEICLKLKKKNINLRERENDKK